MADAGREAFVYALQNGLRLGSAVALAGALAAWTLIARRASVPAGYAADAALPT